MAGNDGGRITELGKQRERGEGRLESGGSQPIEGPQDLTGVMAFISSRLRKSQQEEDWLAGDWRQVLP